MYLRKFLIAGILCCQAPGVLTAQESPALGVTTSRDQLAEIDFTILPNGEGLPPGSGDARSGLAVYGHYCLACHGESGVGGINDRLAGGLGSLRSENPTKTIGSFWPYATTLFDYIRRAMPYPSPGILSDDEIYSVTAYLLYLNGLVEQNTVIDKDTLPAVEMPNQNGFDWAHAVTD